jgi:hypothetical protein
MWARPQTGRGIPPIRALHKKSGAASLTLRLTRGALFGKFRRKDKIIDGPNNSD